MIRKFITYLSDNNPTTTRVLITPYTTNGTQIIETAFPVSWAIIVGGGDNASSTTKGPIYFDPDGSTTYSISDIASGDTYQDDSLEVFLNGQLLDNSFQFIENGDQDHFTLIIGAGSLESIPNVDNTRGTLSFTGQINSFTAGKTIIQSSTGVTALILEVSNDYLTSGQLLLSEISDSSSLDNTGIIETIGGTPGEASVVGEFVQGGDRLAIVYRPAVITSVDGVNVYISKIYPDLATGFEIAYSNATISESFYISLVYS